MSTLLLMSCLISLKACDYFKILVHLSDACASDRMCNPVCWSSFGNKYAWKIAYLLGQ